MSTRRREYSCPCTICKGKLVPKGTRDYHRQIQRMDNLRQAGGQRNPAQRARTNAPSTAPHSGISLSTTLSSAANASLSRSFPSFPSQTPSFRASSITRSAFTLTRLPFSTHPSIASRLPRASPGAPPVMSLSHPPSTQPQPSPMLYPAPTNLAETSSYYDEPLQYDFDSDSVARPLAREPEAETSSSSQARGHHTEAESRGREHERRVAAVEHPNVNDDIGDSDESDDELGESSGPSTAPPAALLSSPNLPLDPATPTCNPRYPNENVPDPFFDPKVGREQLAGSITPSNTHPALFLLYLTVTWLHTHWKLPFLACNALLSIFWHILAAAGVMLEVDARFKTLQSTLGQSGIEPSFNILPVCPSCLEVHPSTIAKGASCLQCSGPLFRETKRLPTQPAESSHSGSAPSQSSRPIVQFPHKSIEAQLRDILSLPNIEDELEKWRTLPRRPGYYQDSFDGRVLRRIRGPDGRLFFENPSIHGELRIALTLGIDWFSYLRSQTAPSHTSGPISFNIVNLPPYLRYRVVNMLLAGIMPGRKEQNGDQVQRFLRPYINELLRLYYEGFVVKTAKYPQGRRVRVVLACVICDKPAAHKLGGFGGHSHTFFCTRCWIKKDQKTSPQAFSEDGFSRRTHAEQVRLGQEYGRCTTEKAREDFVKAHATRWSELARLPYFDLCTMIVVDPMHNLMLGLVKNHFYQIWIQGKVLRKTKELRRLHAVLGDLSIPAHVGRLPPLMGESAGGSLTADQWMIAATIVCPIAIPQIWDEYMEGDPETVRFQRLGDFKAVQDAKKAAKEAARKRRQEEGEAFCASRPQRKRKRSERGRYNDELRRRPPPEDDDDSDTPDAGAVEQETDIFQAGKDAEEEETDRKRGPRLHPDDPGNFFKLSAALNILLALTIDDVSIDQAGSLLEEYCQELIHLYGPDVIRPNHHYAIHLPECIRDFGPLHCFWTFLFERMNKILKSYNSANHSGGELEVSFFREFHRTVQQSRKMASALSAENIHIQASLNAMYASTADDRGTVQSLARESEERGEDGGVGLGLSRLPVEAFMPPELYNAALKYFNAINTTGLPVVSHISPSPGIPLLAKATFFDYVVVSQRRYWAASRTKNRANSFVSIHLGEGTSSVAELRSIVYFKQPHLTSERGSLLGWVRWLVPKARPVPTASMWNEMYKQRVRVEIWEREQFDSSMNTLIPLENIQSHVVLTTANVAGTKCWVTVPVDKNARGH